MPQLSGLNDAATVHANILSGAQRILDLIIEYERVPVPTARSARHSPRPDWRGRWLELEHRIKSLITNLHAPESDRVVGTLSGGEKRRVALCRALLARPDFLILDEPTNHLDTGSIEWLEDFLARYAAPVCSSHTIAIFSIGWQRGSSSCRAASSPATTATTPITCSRARSDKRSRSAGTSTAEVFETRLQWVRKAPRARRAKSVDRVERYFEMAAQEAPEASLTSS